MRNHRHTHGVGAALVVLAAGVGLMGGAASFAAGDPGGGRGARGVAPAATRPGAVGRTAHALSVKDEGHLHNVSKETSGATLVEEGPVTGTIPGTVKVDFDIGPTVTASFTIYAKGGGSISGHGKGTLHSTSLYSTFGGSLTVTRGTGRYAHAHGTGGLYGAIDRRTYALTVQTIGTLYY
jgi:hypothetical protein